MFTVKVLLERDLVDQESGSSKLSAETCARRINNFKYAH
jgi:hypothetical protein